MELLSPMAVMSEGLGFNLCVVPFLNICVPNIPQGSGWRLVGGAILEFKSSHLLSQDRAEVNLYGIAARYVVTVVSKKMWELHNDSHAVTIQWVHVVVDLLLPI